MLQYLLKHTFLTYTHDILMFMEGRQHLEVTHRKEETGGQRKVGRDALSAHFPLQSVNFELSSLALSKLDDFNNSFKSFTSVVKHKFYDPRSH